MKLIPAIIQNKNTLEVRMLGYMNREALAKTRKTQKVWFYSRSKKRLWMKGEESGNILRIENPKKDILFDCDRDTILIKALPVGPTCHTGAISCFDCKKLQDPTCKSVLENTFQPEKITKNNKLKNENAFEQLFAIIEKRKKEMPKNSYTASLFREGLGKICDKIEEESDEVIRAAKRETKKRLIEESVDLIYHLATLLAQKGIQISKIEQEILKRRK